MVVPVPLHMHLSFADGLFWASVACCAVAQCFILRSIGGRSHVRDVSATLPRQRGTTEILWALVPAVALAVVLAFTWRAVRASPASVEQASSTIEPAR